MISVRRMLSIAAAVVAVFDTCTLAAASSSGCNSGIQYFDVPGFRTAAVIEDGMLKIDISDVYNNSVRPATGSLGPFRYLLKCKCNVVM